MGLSRQQKISLGVFVALGLIGVAVKASRRKGLTDYGADRMGEFFSLDEFTRSQVATQYGIQEQFNPSADKYDNGRRLAQFVLDPVRRELGLPIIVNSWYRSDPLNDKLIELGYPAVENSRHKRGDSADVKTNYQGERRNDLLIRAALRKNVPFDRLLIEHGTDSRPQWIQFDYDSSKTPEEQAGVIIRIPSGTTGYYISREDAENMYL